MRQAFSYIWKDWCQNVTVDFIFSCFGANQGALPRSVLFPHVKLPVKLPCDDVL